MTILSLFQRAFFPKPTPAAKNCWQVVGSSRPGTAHIRRSKTCEDAIGWFISGELLVIAVADGAGSAAQAALGSTLAVRTALITLLDRHEKCPVAAETATQALASACQTTLNTLAARAAEVDGDPGDLASTLIVVVANRSFVAAAQVGDGAVVVKDGDGNLTSLTTPANGEFANETFLLGCSQWNDVRIHSLPTNPDHVIRIKSIAVFTDGIQRLALKLPRGDPHAPFFIPLFDRLERLAEPDMQKLLQDFLDSPQVNARTDDDKSLDAGNQAG